MGQLFRTFDEAWRHFLVREEPLEDFFAGFPAAGTDVEGWFVMADDAVQEAARRVQDELAAVDWLVPVPPQFLHVTLATSSGGEADLADAAAFDMEVARVNCFHEAVVAEVTGVPRELVQSLAPGADVETFLPHVTVGVVRGRRSAAPLRDLLLPLRERFLARQHVRDIHRCRVAVGRDDSLIARWDVLESIPLG